MLLQLGVMEVQAHHQAGIIERHIWDLNPHSTVHFDQKRNTYAGETMAISSFQLAESGDICEGTYGFLPCFTSVGSTLFLVLGFGYLFFLAAKFISDGSELLLEVGMALL
ncbi:hypothetical protein KC19_3G170800 [Ceratodon purpureus]|uniref:Uncharacterized protein n=1 Tax=Ceratodon purpureus TaxID=3225 RepID=A0A8T0ILV9_CERPU|nr:hypothetical protein KC19_3G170800 [Ceratodon purpureus]